MGLSAWLNERRVRTEQRHAEKQRRAIEAELSRSVSAANPRPVPAKTARLSAAGRMAVVGESHYQAALRLASSGAVVERFDQGVPVTCALVPELNNPYDNNAVRVDCLTPHGAVTVGYIDRHSAPAYQYQLLSRVPRDTLGICRGMIMGGGAKHYGIWLSVADPSSMIMSSQPDVGHQLLAPDITVAVTGEQNYATALAALHGGASGPTRHYATLRPVQIAKGVHSGEPTLEVLIGGDAVGQLTATMGQRYLPLLHADIPMCCEACVLPGEKRYEVTLHLPKVN
jgi:hypothetical protein